MANGEARFWIIRPLNDAPDRLVEPYSSTMEAVIAVVLGQVMLPSVKDERRAANPIGKAPDQRAQVGVLRKVFRERREREDDVIANALAVRYFDPDDVLALGNDLRPQPGFIPQG